MHWRRKWQPTPVFLPGESQGRGSLVGCRLGAAVYGVARSQTRVKRLSSSSSSMSIESVMPSNCLILCCPILFLPSVFPSIRVFSNKSALHIRWPKYWSFNFSISPSNKYSGLISFRIDWFDLFEVQGTLKSLLQHYNLKISILRHSAFFMVQLSHPYMTTGKTIGLTAAAAAKSLQSCLTLCDPIDGSPSGSAVPGILQARTLEWVAISFSNA